MNLPNYDCYRTDIYDPERIDLRIPYAYLKKFGSQKAVWLSTLIGHYFHFKGFADDCYPDNDLGHDFIISFEFGNHFGSILKISNKDHNRFARYFKKLGILNIEIDEECPEIRGYSINWPVLLDMFPELKVDWRPAYLPSIDYYPSEDFLELYQQPESNQPEPEPVSNGKVIDLIETRKNRKPSR